MLKIATMAKVERRRRRYFAQARHRLFFRSRAGSPIYVSKRRCVSASRRVASWDIRYSKGKKRYFFFSARKQIFKLAPLENSFVSNNGISKLFLK